MSVLTLIVEGKKFVFIGPKLIFYLLELERTAQCLAIADDDHRLFDWGIVLVFKVSFFKFLHQVLINLVKTQCASSFEHAGCNLRQV